MNCICPFKTRHGFFRISSVASGSSFFFSSFSSFFASALPSSFFSFSPVELAAAPCSSTSIISLPRSLAATESVAAEPTTVVPGVAATETFPLEIVEDAPPSKTEPPMEALSSMSTSAPEAFFSSLSSFSFFSFSCLAFAAVDRTAVAAFVVSSFLGGCSGSGYANTDGLAPLLTEKFFGIFSFSVKPMMAFGVSVRENMWISGNQYHICVKSTNPTAAPPRSIPDLENKEAQEFRPPASMIPCAKMAPKRVMTSSCLSPITFCNLSLNSLTRSVFPGAVCM
mmetsp:Transcript_59274/g.105357  ORF Transcript_59274/g.105357 Transcript_59274/m.105357 type:complete len:282 (+) Transcript_59274:242-1087(+)